MAVATVPLTQLFVVTETLVTVPDPPPELTGSHAAAVAPQMNTTTLEVATVVDPIKNEAEPVLIITASNPSVVTVGFGNVSV